MLSKKIKILKEKLETISNRKVILSEVIQKEVPENIFERAVVDATGDLDLDDFIIENRNSIEPITFESFSKKIIKHISEYLKFEGYSIKNASSKQIKEMIDGLKVDYKHIVKYAYKKNNS